MAELVNSEVWSGPRKPAVEFHAGAKLAATSEEFAAFRDAAGAWRREASRRLDALKARAARDDDAAALDRERAADAVGQCRAIKDVLRAVGLDLARGLDRAAARARDLEAGGGGAGLVAASLLDLSPRDVDDLLGSLRGDVGGGAPPAASEAAAALAAAVDDEKAASRAAVSTLESQIAYGKQYLKQKDTQLNAATAQINKLEREKKFLQASRDSPGGGGDRSNKTLEAAFEKLRKEYEGLSRTLNGKLAEEAAAAGLADHDQLRLYASKVQSLEARLQEKTMAAAVSERDAHDAKCAVDKLKVELTDAKFDITRLEASVARAELGRTPYVASARKPRSPAPPPSTPVSEHGFALHDDEAADLTVTLDTYVPPQKAGPTVQEQMAALRAEKEANYAKLGMQSPVAARARPLTRAQRAAAAKNAAAGLPAKSPSVARKVSFAPAAKENDAVA